MTGSRPILYPVARDGSGQLRWAADRERDVDYSCIACGSPVSLRAGKIKRPHFGHRPRDPCVTGSSETVLHRTAIEVIRDGFRAAAEAGKPYSLCWRCETCGADQQGSLTRGQRRKVQVEPTVGVYRPDLLITKEQDSPVTVIEVVVTHEPEPSALAHYDDRKLPVVLVRPSWDTLDALRTGLGSVQVLGGRCQSRRHPPALGATDCGVCGSQRPVVGIEVDHEATCRRCAQPVPRLIVRWYGEVVEQADGWCGPTRFSRDQKQVIAFSRPSDYDRTICHIGDPIGVTIRWKWNPTMKRFHALHICPACDAQQGDRHFYRFLVSRPVTRIAFTAICHKCRDFYILRVRETAQNSP